MSLSANASPTSGATPGSFTVHAGGGTTPYDASLAPSPPNPVPAPSVTITGSSPGPWTVDVNDSLPTGTKVWIRVTDDDADSVDVSYTST